MLEMPLLLRERAVVGADDVERLSGGDEGWRGGFSAAVMRGEHGVAMELAGGFQQGGLGGLLDIGGEENGSSRVIQFQNEIVVVGNSERACRRWPKDVDARGFAELDVIAFVETRQRDVARCDEVEERIIGGFSMAIMLKAVADDDFVNAVFAGNEIRGGGDMWS